MPGTLNSPRSLARRDSVLDCGSPLPLFLACTGWESARGLAKQNCSFSRALVGKQSTTWRHFAPVHGESPFALRMHWDLEPTPNPSQEGNCAGAHGRLLPSWEGSGALPLN